MISVISIYIYFVYKASTMMNVFPIKVFDRSTVVFGYLYPSSKLLSVAFDRGIHLAQTLQCMGYII